MSRVLVITCDGSTNQAYNGRAKSKLSQSPTLVESIIPAAVYKALSLSFHFPLCSFAAG
jgi:hypothetical protein